MTISAASIRQVIAIVVSIYGVLTSTVSQMNIHNAATSAILASFGPLIIALQHWLSDPSTGTPTTTTTTTSNPPGTSITKVG